MNYFELFETPVSLQPNQEHVRKKFYELSRQYHPDFYSNATGEEQAEVLEKSSEVNRAFKVLTNADETIKYVLQLKGLLEDEEKYQLPPAFLMQMMELNEQAMEGGREQIESEVSLIQEEIYRPVKDVIDHYTEGVTTDAQLLQVKEYYFKKKYLNRVMQGLG